jgi:hypothetical protein
MSLLDVLRSRHVLRLLAAMVVGRLPTGMVALALVLYARGSGRGWAAAGGLTAAYAAGSAAGAPLLARLMDRRGQTAVLLAAGAASTAAIALVPVVGAGAAYGVVAVAGLATPPLEPALRALWPDLLPADQVTRGYAADATAQELVFLGGPVVVLAGVALFGAAGGLAAAAGAGLAGTLAFATTGPSRGWRPAGADAGGERHWAGPLRSARLRRLYLSVVLVGSTVGVLPVGLTAYAEDAGHRSLGAWLVAANAAGALLGGAAWAASPRWSAAADAEHRVPGLVAVFGLGYLPLAALMPVPGMAAAALASGLLLPPLLTCSYVAVDRLAPTGTTSEAFGWIVTAFLVGSSAGAAVAGALVADGRLAAAFVAAAASSLVGAAVARSAVGQAGRPVPVAGSSA